MKRICILCLSLILFGLTLCLAGCAGESDAPVYEGMSIITNENSASNTSRVQVNTLASTSSSRSPSLRPLTDETTSGETTSEETVYYVIPGKTFTVEVKLSNPARYEILSFTLNEEKYSSFMFKDNSTLELLLLDVTAPETEGPFELTIDAIKYVDGTEIKDVRMKGDRTIKAYAGDAPADFSRPTEGLAFELNADKASYTLAGIGTATDTEIVIPPQYRDLPVTAIKNQAFAHCETVTRVVMPDSITSIGYEAFLGCSQLATLVLSDNITSISAYAFAHCTSLVNVTVPEGIAWIGADAFAECTGLEKVTLPTGMTGMDDNAFIRCSSLTTVVLSEGLTTIGWGAFQECAKLTDISIPQSVTTIESHAFLNCHALYEKEGDVLYVGSWVVGYENLPRHVTLREGTRGLAQSAFEGCSTLESVTIPAGVTEIGAAVFRNCSALSQVNLPDTVTTIGSMAFTSCSSLTAITLPDSITRIENNAFASTGLKSITIPNKVTQLSESVFDGCYSLSRITLSDGLKKLDGLLDDCPNLVFTVHENGNYLGSASNPYFCLVNVKDKTAKSFTIADQTKIIYANAFRECRKLTDITVPEGVIRIGDYAFMSCTNLRSITLPDTLTSVGIDLFAECPNLEEPELPNSQFVYGSEDLYVKDGYCIGSSVIQSDGYLTIYPNGTDPYYYPFQQAIGKRYIAIKYRTDKAENAKVQLYIGSYGSVPVDDSSMLSTPAIGDGQWHIAVLDTQSLIQAGIYDGQKVSYFRFDPLDWGTFDLPEGAYIDVAYIAFCDTLEEAEADLVG